MASAGELSMGEKLEYESGVDRARDVSAHRRTVWRIVISVFVVLLLVVLGLGFQWWYHDTRITAATSLTVRNNTSSTITDAGFDCVDEERVGSIGPILPGQTRTLNLTFNPDTLPVGFVFDQSGQTFHVPLEGENALVADGSGYTITITPGKLVAMCGHPGAPTTTLVQIPSTQQIYYDR
jgi:hypothetical protein